jgi:hypothetical protein
MRIKLYLVRYAQKSMFKKLSEFFWRKSLRKYSDIRTIKKEDRKDLANWGTLYFLSLILVIFTPVLAIIFDIANISYLNLILTGFNVLDFGSDVPIPALIVLKISGIVFWASIIKMLYIATEIDEYQPPM